MIQENTQVVFQSKHYERSLKYPASEQAGFTAAPKEHDPLRCRGSAERSKGDTLPEKAGLLPSDLDSESSSRGAASPKSTFPREGHSERPELARGRALKTKSFENQTDGHSKRKTTSTSNSCSQPVIIYMFLYSSRVLTQNAEMSYLEYY